MTYEKILFFIFAMSACGGISEWFSLNEWPGWRSG